MSKTSAPTSSVRGDRSVRRSLPNSLPLDSSEGRFGKNHNLATFHTRLGRWELGLESGVLGVRVKPPKFLLLPSGLVQGTLLAGKEGPGGQAMVG